MTTHLHPLEGNKERQILVKIDMWKMLIRQWKGFKQTALNKHEYWKVADYDARIEILQGCLTDIENILKNEN